MIKYPPFSMAFFHAFQFRESSIIMILMLQFSHAYSLRVLLNNLISKVISCVTFGKYYDSQCFSFLIC